MASLRLRIDGTPATPFGERSATLPALDYNANMLQCTTRSDPWSERVDYLVVERVARDIRNQYIASLLGRAKRALANGFARGARPLIGRAR
jgi:hypothetical protein